MDVEKTIEFMLENQARFDARLGALTEVQSKNQQMIGQLAEVVGELVTVQQRAGERLEEECQRAQQAEQMLREDLNQVGAEVKAVSAEVKAVSGDVRALAKLFEQFIRGDGRGPAAPPH
jgi:predicted  nucleic acid-binding Zn-ribbon protein